MDSDKLDIHALPWITDTSNWNSVRLISVMRTFTSFMLHVLSSTEWRHLGTMLMQINWTIHRIYVNEKRCSKMFLISWVRNWYWDEIIHNNRNMSGLSKRESKDDLDSKLMRIIFIENWRCWRKWSSKLYFMCY